jgi:hypothetical protein
MRDDRMSWRTAPDAAAVVKCDATRGLDGCLAEIEARYRETGLVIVRGAGARRTDFRALGQRFVTRLGVDPFRPIAPDGVQEVNAGRDEIEVHSENASTPLRPDVILFCCVTPPADGGETTYCDGVRVWNGLGEATRALFSTERLKYLARFPAAAWRRMLGPGATVDTLGTYLDELGMRHRMLDDGAVETEYVCSAVHEVAPWGRLAFANSVLSTLADWRDRTSRSVMRENGSPLPDDVVADVRSVVHRSTREIFWGAGDVAIIDNRRYMHGRRAYRDSRRTVLVLMGWCD